MAIGRCDYEERKEARIDRFNKASIKLAHEANDYMRRAHEIGDRIPFGQPILIGHHSEKHARAEANKIWSNISKSVELGEKSTYYVERAEAAENNRAISSDDPTAIEQIQEKIAVLEFEQAEMKAANSYWRKHKTMKCFPEMSDKDAAEIDEQMKTASPYTQKNGPFESWRLSNNNANIRRLKQRLTKLQQLDEMPDDIIMFDGGEIIIDTTENRVKIQFDDRQSNETTSRLKGNGFKWSPTNQCWQRLRTKDALLAAKRIIGGFN